MKRFCKECGQELPEGAKFCKNCGARVDDTKSAEGPPDSQTKRSAKKTPMTRKQKFSFGAAGLIVICIIIFAVWGNTHYSEEKTMERFSEALASGESGTVQQLVTVDGEEVSQEEAVAMTRLAEDTEHFTYEQNGDARQVFADFPVFQVEEKDKKALLFFTDYHVSAEPQYVSVVSDIEGVETTFDGKTVPENDSEGSTLEYGPLAPGVYEVSSVFETAFGAVDASQETTLLDGDNEFQPELDVEDTRLHLSNKYGLPYDAVELKLNGEVLDSELEDEEVSVGPLLTDGSVELTGTAETSWGEVEIPPVKITEPQQDIEVDLMNDALKEEISDVIISFSEDYIKALAEQDASAISGISESLQEDFNDQWFIIKEDEGFSGKLDQVGISFKDFSEEEVSERSYNVYDIPIQLTMTGQFADDSEDDHFEYKSSIQLRYDENQWEVYGFERNYFGNASDYETYDGSGETVEGVKNDDDKDTDNDSEETDDTEISSLVEDYVYDLAEAVNNGEYSLVSEHIASGSEFETMQSDLVDRQNDSGLRQTVENVDVGKVSETGDDEWKVETTEVIELEYANGDTETATYDWTYTVEKIDDDYRITGLE